jgi:DNA-binding MarR family transcriptional regulator
MVICLPEEKRFEEGWCPMRVRALVLAALMILFPALSFVTGVSELQGGQKEAVLALSAPSFGAVTNFTLPARYHVLNATVNITGMASEGDSSAYPENVTVMLNDTVIWAFNGTGYGHLGRQDLFSDGANMTRAGFESGGGTSEAAIRLPKRAHVQSATLDVNATLAKRWKELANYTVAPVTDFPIAFDCAGDVNDDGYDDIIVGAGGDDTGGTDAGQAYIFFGGPAMNLTPDVTFTGESPGDLFGTFVSGAGDVNGDGCDDVVVGAPENDSAGDNAGSAYIFFGGPNMDGTADVKMTGEAECDWFGASVSNAGDFNGDGYDDVLIGAEQNEAGGTLAGRAYLFKGGPNMDNVTDLMFTGNPTEYLGHLVSGAGDLNGDGYDDVIVGAYGSDWPYSNAGRAYVYFGGPALDNVADVILNGTGADDDFGQSVAGVGDVNGDGYDDVAVGAVDLIANNTGRVEVFFGGTGMDGKPDVVLKGAYEYDYFGISISGAGDVNNDGYDDIIVGAEGNDTGADWGGRAYIFHGGAVMDNSWDAAFNGTTQYQYFGRPVSTAGDVNNDSYDDILIGGNWGKVFLYSWADDPSPGLIDPGISIGAASIWKKSGYFKGAETTGDFSAALNQYLGSAAISGNDSYGNSYVDIPICVSAKSEGYLSLFNLNITYEYNASVPDFAKSLNNYIAAHMGEQDAYGNLSVPLRVRSESAGRVKLTGLDMRQDLPPVQVRERVSVEMDEDTANLTLIDLYSVFDDIPDLDEALDFSFSWATNSSFVAVSIFNNRYLSADALTGDANDNWTGTVEAVVVCRDTRGLETVSRPLIISVRNVNDPPVITSAPVLSAEPGISYSYNITASDGDDDALDYRLDNAPANMTIDPAIGMIRWLPRTRGIFQVNVLVDDGNATDEQEFTISVPNRPPRITSTPPLSATVGVPYTYNMTAEDPNLDILAFSLPNAPAGMEIRPDTGSIIWIPTAAGDFDVSASAGDGSEDGLQNFTINVVWANRPPMITSATGPNGVRVKAYTTLHFSVDAFDPDGDPLTYSWQEKGAALGGSHNFSRSFPPGEHIVVLSVGDGQYVVTRAFNFTVNSLPPPTGPGFGLAPLAWPGIFAAAVVSMVLVGLLAAWSTEVGKYRLIALFIPLYTRLHKEAVLDNETRGMIRGAISTDPGIHFSEIMRRLKLSNGNALYHLVTLEREGFIKASSDGRLKRFYPADMELDEAPLRLDRMQRTIFETLREQNGMSQRDIARLLNISFSSVNRHLNKMASMGVLRLERRGMSVRCYIDDGKELRGRINQNR